MEKIKVRDKVVYFLESFVVSLSLSVVVIFPGLMILISRLLSLLGYPNQCGFFSDSWGDCSFVIFTILSALLVTLVMFVFLIWVFLKKLKKSKKGLKTELF